MAAELIAGVTTVAEAGGRLEKSYVGSVPKPNAEHGVLAGSLKITGKSNLGKSMYRYKLSDFWVSSCEGSLLAATRVDRKPDYRMDRGHLPKGQIVEPLALGQIPPLKLFDKLSGAVRIQIIARACSRTFSRRPISSRVPSLLGVVESSDPSASRPAHRNKRCLPLRSVLTP